MAISTHFDRKQTERHLQLLDSTATEFTFQLFDDNKARKSTGLARVISGTLDEVWDQLCSYSEQGAGVFVTVNETDGLGRKSENMTRVRAVFQEADTPNVPIPPIKPHIVIESSLVNIIAIG